MKSTIFGARTDRGGVRAENQDAVYAQKLSVGGTARSRSPFSLLGRLGRRERAEDMSEGIYLNAVCDGIGGLERGDLSSGVVVGEMGKWFDSLGTWVTQAFSDPEVLFSHLRDAAEEWNAVLMDTIRACGIRSGTTMSAVLTVGGTYGILHVGDSRIYRYRPTEGVGTKLLQLTEDECVFRLKDGRTRSFLENFVGREDPLSFRFYTGELALGDMLLACTDGFYHRLNESDVGTLYASLAMGASPESAIAAIADEMVARGEQDNLSASLLVFGGCVDENTQGTAAAGFDPDATLI